MKDPSEWRNKALLLGIPLFAALAVAAAFACAHQGNRSCRQESSRIPQPSANVAPSTAELVPEDPRAKEVVERMRGFSIQYRNARSDGQPDPDQIRRDQIMAEFRQIGEGAVPAIDRALRDPDAQMRRNAALALVELAGTWTGKPPVNTRSSIPSLIAAADDPDSHVRGWSALALAEIGPEAKQAVPTLIRLLKDPEEGPRNTSALALGGIGAAAEAAIPALKEALDDPKKDVRRFAQGAIAQIEKACAQRDAETR